MSKRVLDSLDNVSDTRLEAELRHISLPTVSRVANRELEKSRVPHSPDTFKFKHIDIQAADVRLAHDLIKGPAGFEFATGRIIFDPAHFQRFEKEAFANLRPQETEGLFSSLVLLVFFHEVAHKFSSVIRVVGPKNDTVQSSAGIHHKVTIVDEEGKQVGGGRDDYESLNELITNRLAKDMTLEYSRDISVPGVDDETIEQVYQLTHKMNSERALEIFNNFSRLLSEKSGLPEDVVWRGFKEAYFRNRSIKEFEEEMKLFTGVDFTEELNFHMLMKILNTLKK